MSIPYLNSCPKVDCSRKNDCRPFRKIVIPAVLGDDSEDSEVAPENGAYCDALVEYEANGAAYFYSSDGIPTKLTYTTTDYNALTNKPTINGVTLEGNQSSSSLGININDATLTLKQGDTTLGTFSANANENVEINVGDSPLKLSVELGANPRWFGDGAIGQLFYYGAGGTSAPISSNLVRAREFSSALTEVNFRNEDTDELLTIEAVFSLLEDGKEVIINNIPAIYHDTRTGTYYLSDAKVDGALMSQSEQVSYSDDSRNLRYTGSVAMQIKSPDGLATQQDIVYGFISSFSIVKEVYDSSTQYYISVDGIEDSIVAD